MAFWAFAVGQLTGDQRALLRWLLPIASAISAGAFTGALSVKSKVLWPATVAAGGGFAVWVLASHALFALPQAPDFPITIYLRDEQGNATEVDGNLLLELKNQENWAISGGQSLPRNIPAEWVGKSIRIRCKVYGYKQVNPKEMYKLAPDAIIEIELKKDG